MSFFLFFCFKTKEPKIQDFGYSAKNQFIQRKISKLAPCGRFEQWIFSTFRSLIFLTPHLQGRKRTLEKNDNLKWVSDIILNGK